MTTPDDLWTDSGLLDLRSETLRQLGWSLLALGIGGTPLLPLIFGAITPAAIGATFALIVVGVLVSALSTSRPRLATISLLVGLAGILTLGSAVFPGAVLLPWLIVLILISGFLAGPQVGLAIAAASSLSLITAVPLGDFGLSPVVRASWAVLFGAAAGLSWLAFRPLLVAMQWSWDNYVAVRTANDLLKDRQGELNRTLKSLNETLDRLDQVNRELERARRAANQARQLKSEFAVNVSHELRTPLNLIIGFSEMMVTAPQSYQGQVLPPAYRDDALAIYRSARHLSDLVDDILDLGQIEAGRMALHREHLALASVLREAVETVQILFTQKQLTLETIVPPDLPPIFADRTRLRQIVINLLSNAARFTDRGGVTIQARVDERDHLIAISDTGTGIMPSDLPRIFDEFWQGNDPRRRSGGGGVGLAVSKRFVEMHSGSIWVESAEPRGTTFTFTIPLGTYVPEIGVPRPWETWARLRAPIGERPALALVSEDQEVVHLFERYLDDYAIVPVRDATALAVLPPTTDLRGTVVIAPDGLTAHRRALAIQARRPGTPIIACGMNGTHRTLAERLDVTSYLVKPISRERVRQILQKLDRSVKRILVVDDDADSARLLARMIRLTSRRFAVTTVTSGAEALRVTAEEHPDAVFVDLVMPEVDGYTFIETVRHDPARSNLAIVAVSAKALDVKPLSSDGLIAVSPGGIPVGVLIDCLRATLTRLADSNAASEPVEWPGGLDAAREMVGVRT